ncbi:GvpL/GvpF family gas vesicle protein [Streptomyces sp. N2-109]|uniref:GvpL/GvpF family gas vesicle protein n=1 Tax=Streptomyces gossypii TaxID=2883101 RepID=A0ABT2K3L5_9ACTN|nr:GvpL/GvpF family gas vesicle protein [Streptomyces gossypii]MCT2594757.1 GvpL/GvpF family gas vesicle protein [Streptomyces gossypii]
MSTSRLYVYGIVHADRVLPPGTSGVGRPAALARLLPVGELAAVVSDVPEGLRARRRDLMAHQALLTEVGAEAPVLPMRFGMVAQRASVVEDAVGSAATAHLAALDRLDGRTEMNLKAMTAQSHVEALVRDDADVRRLMATARRQPSYEGNVRLGQAVAEALDRRASESVDEVLPELRALAEGFVRGPDVPGCVLNVSFLVPKAGVGRFRAAVEHLADAYSERLELRLAGPLPCYSFVPQEGTGSGPAGRPVGGRTAEHAPAGS